MIRFLKLHDVVVGANNSLPTLAQTGDGKAMGFVPGWKAYFDPEFMRPSSGILTAALNRVDGVEYTPATSGQVSLVLDPETAQKFVECTVTPSRGLSISAANRVNPQEWSFWCVVKPDWTTGGTAIRQLVNDADESRQGVGLSVALDGSTRSVVVYDYFNLGFAGAPVRATAKLPENGSKVTVLMVTFSAQEGIKIFANGKEVARNVADKRLFTRTVDTSVFWRYFRGLAGRSGMLDIDLGAVQNEGYRKSIEAFLLNKYVIS